MQDVCNGAARKTRCVQSEMGKNAMLLIRKCKLAAAASVLAGLATMISPSPLFAQAGSAPLTVINSLNATLLDAMKRAGTLGVKGRYDALSPVLTKTYDMATMSKLAVGPSWEALPAGQKTEMIDAFTRMMVATYAKRFDGYSGEKFEVLQVTDKAPSDKMVKTRIVQSNGKPVALNYIMRSIDGEWRVVDVYLDGTISELASRRSEFTSILKASGPTALIASLRKQGDKLLTPR